MTQAAFAGLMDQNGISGAPSCNVQFQSAAKAVKAIPELQKRYDLPEESISQNTAVMGSSGFGTSESMKNFYGIAARFPAKRAAKVSPMAAVSGNAEVTSFVRHGVKRGNGRIEWKLGFHHAMESKRNWFMMTASFSLSIILFLCFTVGLDFGRQLIPTLRSWQPDLILNGYVNALVLEQDLGAQISEVPGVAHVFGSSYMESVPAVSSREGIDHINLVSYSDYLLDSNKDNVVQGDLSSIYGDSDEVMTINNKDNPLKVGDTIQINGKELKITCAVSDGLYSGEPVVICSQENFERLTGEQNYNLIGVQLGKNATDETVEKISGLAASDVIFSDERETKQENKATYLAALFIGYGFLAVVAIITLFNIINSISMSVTARIKQYGSMIAAETFTYALSGLVFGCGFALHHIYIHFYLCRRSGLSRLTVRRKNVI